MSELPIAPVLDEKSEQIKHNAERIINDPYENAAFFRHAEQQVAPQPTRVEKWDLDREETLDTGLWTKDELETPVKVIEQLETIQQPMTHAQEVEQSLFYLTDKQLLAYAIANTKAVWALKHLF